MHDRIKLNIRTESIIADAVHHNGGIITIRINKAKLYLISVSLIVFNQGFDDCFFWPCIKGHLIFKTRIVS